MHRYSVVKSRNIYVYEMSLCLIRLQVQIFVSLRSQTE
jgi:hypothetical protein